MRRRGRLLLPALLVCSLALWLGAGASATARAQGGGAEVAPAAQAPAAESPEALRSAPAEPRGETAGEPRGEGAIEARSERAGEGQGEGGGKAEEEEHALNLVTLTAGLLHGSQPAAASLLLRFQAPIFSAIVAVLLMAVLARVVARKTAHPGRLQMAVELIFEGLYDLFRAVIGPDARRYTPYLGTLFLFILCNNLLGLVPFMFASTSVINTTVALAICTFLYVQYIGIKENGILGYLYHMAGTPRSPMEWGFSLLLFPLHVLGEFIKPMSLSLRLFGNIFGEETLTATFIVLGAGMLAGLHVPVGIPIQVPIMFLGMLTSTIQALVFTLLSTVYIALMLPHHEREEAHGH